MKKPLSSLFIPLFFITKSFGEAFPEPHPQIPHYGNPVCDCGANFVPPPCAGSFCECLNVAVIACWIPMPFNCAVSLQSCPESSGIVESRYPACGTGLPECKAGLVCRKASPACKNNISRVAPAPGCLGFCVPQPKMYAQPPKQPSINNPLSSFMPNAGSQSSGASKSNPKSLGGLGAKDSTRQPQGGQLVPNQPQGGQLVPNQPQGGQLVPNQPRPAGDSACNIQCTMQQVCLRDPYNQVEPRFRCADASGVCGGLQNNVCSGQRICVQDPRILCSGYDCTGLCV